MSIGSPPEKFPPLKTKDLADLAGLSPSIPPLNLNALFPLEDSQDFLNNNSSIVTEPQEIWDVQEVGHQPLWTIWLDPESVLMLLTNMKPETETVEKALAHGTLTPSTETPLSLEDPLPLLNLLVTLTQFQFVSTLPHGLSTLQVS